MAERYLYLPLIGLCGLVGSLLLQPQNVVNAEMCSETGTHNVRSLQKRKGKQKYFVSFLLIISVLFMIRTFIRNYDWKDDITLAKKTIQTTPKSVKSHYNLGYYYLKANVLSQAEEEFRKAIEIDKNYAPAYNNLGLIYKELGNNDKALQYYLKTLEIDKNYIHTQFNLGNLYQDIGEYEKAILYYKNALKLDKNYFGANVNLGNVYLKLGDYDKAVEYYKKALEIEPENTDVKENFKIAEDLKRNTKP
jgi:tetratricopeptide (TPR) repeat protein